MRRYHLGCRQAASECVAVITPSMSSSTYFGDRRVSIVALTSNDSTSVLSGNEARDTRLYDSV